MNTTRVSLLESLRSSSQEERWQELLAIYSPFVESHLRRLRVEDHDVSDISQDVMAILVQELPNFRHNGRKGAFRTWLRHVAANRLRSFRRKQANKPCAFGGSEFFRLASSLADPASDASREWDAQHDRFLVNRLLGLVAKRFRDNTMSAFRLVVLQQQSVEKVALQLNMTVNAVRIAQARVLRALREVGAGLID